MTPPEPALSPPDALSAWGLPASLRPAEDGLINRTWIVQGRAGPHAVLQWVNPIFSPLVTADIDAVGRWLQDHGMISPRPLPRPGAAQGEDDRLLADPAGGHWRLLSFVPGRTLHRMSGPALAFEAGALVGRFHAVLRDFPGPFRAPPRRVHETPSRMAELEQASRERSDHPLFSQVEPVAQAILEDWGRWEGSLRAPERPCHGDLKLSNLRFDEEGRRGVCLLDLDTLGALSYSVELGDAWRSWCNPAGEDAPEATRFDLALFEASARGWRFQGPALDGEERDSLVPGVERICLELAARFARDALLNTYFREDRGRHPQPGAHNLLRARAQLRLARSAREQAPACRAILAAG